MTDLNDFFARSFNIENRLSTFSTDECDDVMPSFMDLNLKYFFFLVLCNSIGFCWKYNLIALRCVALKCDDKSKITFNFPTPHTFRKKKTPEYYAIAHCWCYNNSGNGSSTNAPAFFFFFIFPCSAVVWKAYDR